MAFVSITKAAKLAGVSRNTMYRTYITKGLVTISRDASGAKGIDTSELLRVFGALQGDSQESVTVVQDVTTDCNADQADQINTLKAELQRSLDREEWYQSQIKTLTDTVKLLEDKRPKSSPSSGLSLVRFWRNLWK